MALAATPTTALPQTSTAPARPSYPPLVRREQLSAAEFFAEYVAKGRPVCVSGALRDCTALSRWSLPYLRTVAGERTVKLKPGLNTANLQLNTVSVRLADYLDALQAYESDCQHGNADLRQRPAYLHDVPLLGLLPAAEADLQGLPLDYFPRWYRTDWAKFAQFFLGPKHSLTPLHFDCLLTHNLFFQVAGRKRFILLGHDQLPWCYCHHWRWCAVNPEAPDFDRHPLFRHAQVQECTVEPGDLLYLPPGMLHHVRSLDCTLSFNVDWHTRRSALRGVLAFGRGMPVKNVYYNAVMALGLCAGLSTRQVLRGYGSYLNYVS